MRKRLATLCVTFLVFSLALAGQEGSQEPLDIGSRLELFVDNFLIDAMDRVQLRLHHPVPREVVLVLDRLWEGITSGYPSTVFRDGNIYRMYYRGTDWDFDKRRAACRWRYRTRRATRLKASGSTSAPRSSEMRSSES